ncbi:MAG: cytochrome c biogenesis protein CcsA [Bradymonadia bacterium]
MEIAFGIGVGLFALTTLTYLAALWGHQEGKGTLAHWMLGGTLALWGVLLIIWATRHGVAGGNRLLLGSSAWSLGALYLVLLRRHPITALGSFVTAPATVLGMFTLLIPNPEAALMASTSDGLLVIHITLAFIGITAFTFATAVSLLYLLQLRLLKDKKRSALRKKLPPLEVLDRLSLRGIVVGFPFYTLALLLGSAFALKIGPEAGLKSAYIFAGVSWLIYGGVLQARLTAGWRGRRAAVLTAAGLILAMVVVAQYTLGFA